MAQKHLPKYYIVKNDGSKEFRRFIEFLNKTYDRGYEGDGWEWYGYDGNEIHNGTNMFDNPARFINNPVRLTAQEFCALLDKPDEELGLHDIPLMKYICKPFSSGQVIFAIRS